MRKVVKLGRSQQRLVPVVPVARATRSASVALMNKKKRELHMLNKRVKAGLVDVSSLTEDEKRLLTKYFGY
jgi:hypothetical protein